MLGGNLGSLLYGDVSVMLIHVLSWIGCPEDRLSYHDGQHRLISTLVFDLSSRVPARGQFK